MKPWFNVLAWTNREEHVETVSRLGNLLFWRFRPFVASEIIQNNLRMRTNAKEVRECMIVS
jgi:hypothetical protein